MGRVFQDLWRRDHKEGEDMFNESTEVGRQTGRQ